jgi:hypothetical protein
MVLFYRVVMKKKKLKLKTKYKFLLIIIAIFLVTFFSMNFLFNIILIGDKDIYLNVNSSYFENGYKATFFGKKLKVDVKNNIDNTSLGDYKVTYTANLLNFKKSVIRNVHVVDNEKPVITLNGDNIIYLNKDSKYEEPGYEITDNYDKDINSKIKVTNNIDETKAGKYEVVYEAIDSSKNKAKVVRTVEVLDDSALTSSIKDFTLKGLFTKTTLTYEENEYNYFNDTIFLGDSNTSFLYQKGKHISAYQTWARNNLNIAQMNSSTFETYENRQNTVLNDALTKYDVAADQITIKTADNFYKIALQDIIFAEVINRKVIIHTITAEYVSVFNFQYWTDTLSADYFFQPHRCFIVNMYFVSRFDRLYIYLCHDRYKALLSRRKYAEFKDHYLRFIEMR